MIRRLECDVDAARAATLETVRPADLVKPATIGRAFSEFLLRIWFTMRHEVNEMF